jgi:hypothetical protein
MPSTLVARNSCVLLTSGWWKASNAPSNEYALGIDRTGSIANRPVQLCFSAAEDSQQRVNSVEVDKFLRKASQKA